MTKTPVKLPWTKRRGESNAGKRGNGKDRIGTRKERKTAEKNVSASLFFSFLLKLKSTVQQARNFGIFLSTKAQNWQSRL